MQYKSDGLSPKTNQQITKLINLADNLFDKGMFEKCIVYYNQLLQNNLTLPNLVYVLYMRGCAFEETGKIEQACEDWQQAKTLDYEHPSGVDLVEMALAKYR